MTHVEHSRMSTSSTVMVVVPRAFCSGRVRALVLSWSSCANRGRGVLGLQKCKTSAQDVEAKWRSRIQTPVSDPREQTVPSPTWWEDSVCA